jgi:hypothetical protein
LSEIGRSSSPTCPQPRGVVHCPRSDVPHHPPVLYREGWSIVRDRTFLITPLSSTERGGPLSEIGCSSSPHCPQPRGVVHCPRSDVPHHPPVFYREGWSIVRDQTFLITPLSFTERGGPLSEIGRFSSAPCPQPRGVVHCPRSDGPHHPPVLNREGWSIVRDRTFLITPLSSTERGGPLSEIGRSSSPLCPLPRGVVHCPRSDVPHHPLSSTERGGPLSEIGRSSSPPCPQPRGVVHCPRSDVPHHPLSSTERGGPLSEIGLFSLGLILVFFPLFFFLTRLLLLFH